jgi:fermentation-respiration switch protein FrsA (DUF1100 family)
MLLALAHRPRRALRAALALGVAGLALASGARLASRRFLYPAHQVAPLSAPPDAEALTTRARDGVPVHALRLRGPEGAPVAVYFHTNRETMVHGLALGRALAARGLSVVCVEYRGYGASAGGEACEDGLYLDAEAALDALADEGVGPSRIVLVGASLGTGVAAEMARRGRGAALALIAPFTSIPDVVEDATRFSPSRLLVRDAFDTLGKSGDIRVPTRIVHGDADEIVPFWMGERLASAIAGARLVAVAGGRHGDLLVRAPGALVDAIAGLAPPAARAVGG